MVQNNPNIIKYQISLRRYPGIVDSRRLRVKDQMRRISVIPDYSTGSKGWVADRSSTGFGRLAYVGSAS